MRAPEQTSVPIERTGLSAGDSVKSAIIVVSDLVRSVSFYRDVIGLSVHTQTDTRVTLGANDEQPSFLTLEQGVNVSPIRERSRLGLFHTAFLLPDRNSLGSFVRHLTELGIPFGAADHDVSEAVYLSDPDGLTVEVYRDRSSDEWHYLANEVLITTDPLDFVDLAAATKSSWAGAPKQTRIGHLHFYVGNLARARALYVDGLGLNVRYSGYPGALFVAAGGYHHHVGLNIWAKGAPLAGPADARLNSWEFKVEEAELRRTAERMLLVGWKRLERESSYSFTDDWGISVRLVGE